MSSDWTPDEVAATVAAYLRMLTMELTGQAYNKSEHRRALHQLLPGRSEGAIEFKHCNISAVMIELGFPHIPGYKQRKNFQRQALFEEVIRQIAARPQLEDAARKAVELPAEAPPIERFDAVRVEPPPLKLKVREQDAYQPSALSQRDYLAREARNRSLGLPAKNSSCNTSAGASSNGAMSGSRTESSTRHGSAVMALDTTSFLSKRTVANDSLRSRRRPTRRKRHSSSATVNSRSRTRMNWSSVFTGSLSFE
jgi:hypothetical protein